VVRITFRDACRDRTDTDFRYQLYADARRRIAVLQIVDQLLKILDRINVVMRRRTDETDARRRITNAGNIGIDLAARQLATFAWLGTLRNLDLEFVSVGQVPDRHAKPARRHLFDRRPLRVAIRHWLEAFRIFATFTGVALAAEAVHRDRERFVSLGR